MYTIILLHCFLYQLVDNDLHQFGHIQTSTWLAECQPAQSSRLETINCLFYSMYFPNLIPNVKPWEEPHFFMHIHMKKHILQI